jgi:hypothetical protein
LYLTEYSATAEPPPMTVDEGIDASTISTTLREPMDLDHAVTALHSVLGTAFD